MKTSWTKVHRVTFDKKEEKKHRLKYLTGYTNHEGKEVFGGTPLHLFSWHYFGMWEWLLIGARCQHWVNNTWIKMSPLLWVGLVVRTLTWVQAVWQWTLKSGSIDRKTWELLLRITSSWGHFTGGRRCRFEDPQRVEWRNWGFPARWGISPPLSYWAKGWDQWYRLLTSVFN